MNGPQGGAAFLVGAWFLHVRVGEPPSALERELINILFADAVAAFAADGTASVSVSPVYPVPDQAVSTEHLLVGTGFGTWTSTGERTAAVTCGALIRDAEGNSVATLVLTGAVEHDAESDTFSGPYTIESHLTRAWSRNLPSLDGSVQGWRVG
ncbi:MULTISPECIES: hypothetical protein [unclassified Geodermatophilus]|uniref:hypothetical protein n=1 Tax=unclassified Geodermatophilus TaxID=2637632 RepID=UPI003EEC5F81